MRKKIGDEQGFIPQGKIARMNFAHVLTYRNQSQAVGVAFAL